MAKEIKCEVIKKFGKLSDKGAELRLVSWNDAEAKFDLRSWYEKDGEERPNKGNTLTKEELKELIKLGTKALKEMGK